MARLQRGISRVFESIVPLSVDARARYTGRSFIETPLHPAPSKALSSRSYPRLINLLGGSGLVDPEVANRSQIPLLDLAKRLSHCRRCRAKNGEDANRRTSTSSSDREPRKGKPIHGVVEAVVRACVNETAERLSRHAYKSIPHRLGLMRALLHNCIALCSFNQSWITPSDPKNAEGAQTAAAGDNSVDDRRYGSNVSHTIHDGKASDLHALPWSEALARVLVRIRTCDANIWCRDVKIWFCDVKIWTCDVKIWFAM